MGPRRRLPGSSPAASTWSSAARARPQPFTDSGLPRDGGMADLWPRPARRSRNSPAVVCEDIERSGRDMFNALKLEKELSRQGIPLFATDDGPIRRRRRHHRPGPPGEARGGGMVPAPAQGKDLGKASSSIPSTAGTSAPRPTDTPPSGAPHPVPYKASPRPHQSPPNPRPGPRRVIAQIFAWRAVDSWASRPSPPGTTPTPPATRPGPGYRIDPSRTWPPCWETQSTPGSWPTGGTAPPPSHPRPPTSGCGRRPRSTRPSWAGHLGHGPTVAAGRRSSGDGDELNSHPAAVGFSPPGAGSNPGCAAVWRATPRQAHLPVRLLQVPARVGHPQHPPTTPTTPIRPGPLGSPEPRCGPPVRWIRKG